MAEPALVVRLGGLAAVVGGLLWSVEVLIATTSGPLGAPLWPAKGSDYLFVIVQLLFLAGIAGLYAPYSSSSPSKKAGGGGERRAAVLALSSLRLDMNTHPRS